MRRVHVFLFVLLLCYPNPAAHAVDLRPDHPVLQQRSLPLSGLVGETLIYDISFLWFDQLAEGRLSFVEGERPNTFKAVLEAKTLGVAAWVTSDRIQRYVSHMEIGPDGRLRSLSFESRIIKGDGKNRRDTTRLYTFDYGKQQIRYQRARNDKFYKEEFLPMSRIAPPNDVLTAFFNLRAGFFGPLKPGSHYTVPTFDREGNEEIEVEILTMEKRPKEHLFPGHGLLGRVILDKEVIGTDGGAVYVWFDALGRPLEGVVENVVGLGNVRGKFRK